jgi:hypothetical protein
MGHIVNACTHVSRETTTTTGEDTTTTAAGEETTTTIAEEDTTTTAGEETTTTTVGEETTTTTDIETNPTFDESTTLKMTTSTSEFISVTYYYYFDCVSDVCETEISIFENNSTATIEFHY